MSAEFPVRMLYATTRQLRERAVAADCNWALVHSMGHKAHRSNDNPLPNDDLPIWFNADPKVAALRRARKKSAIDFERRLLLESVEHAHELGLKTMIHCYDVSIPPELREVYPKLYRPMVKEYRNCSADTKNNFEPCLADPRVRELISAKTAEIVSLVPGIDAYAFSFNECLSLTKVRHRCELCRDIPFWQMIKWLADAVAYGVRSASPGTQVFHRMWGTNEHDDVYYKFHARLKEFTLGAPPEPWLERHVQVYAPRNMHYKPSEDLKKYLALQRGTGMGFVAKATWADVSVNMPLNPWLKELPPKDTIVELSFEQTSGRADGFHVLADQFQRMARHCRQLGITGLAGVPVAWGYRHNEEPPDRGFVGAEFWKLGVLNFDAFAAVGKNPEADLRAAIAKALKARYGKALPGKLADLIIESQHLKAATDNIRGIRANAGGLKQMYCQILRYAPTVKGSDKLLSRAPANLKRMLREKDAVIARTAEIVREIEAMKGKIPEKAWNEFMASFQALAATAAKDCRRQKLNLILWAIKDGTIKCDMAAVNQIEECI